MTQLAPGYKKYKTDKYEIIVQEKTGFVNATKICQKFNKKFADWCQNKNTKEYIKLAEQKFNCKVSNVSKGGQIREINGTYLHPALLTYLACWISPGFALQCSVWIEEWKLIENNSERYYEELENIVTYNKNQKELEIANRLQKEIGGNLEVECPVGRIDLLTDNEIIEIKTAKKWKHALGQVIAYHHFYPEHQMRLHLFDCEENDLIVDICELHNVNVSFDE